MLLPALILAAGLALLASCTFDLDYDRYAIVYGVSDYPTVQDLTSTDDDANDMSDLLLSQGFDVILRVTDDSNQDQTDPPSPPNIDEASYDQLDRDFQTVAGQGDLDDLFVFYFSGHGTQLSAGSTENTPMMICFHEGTCFGESFTADLVVCRNLILHHIQPVAIHQVC